MNPYICLSLTAITGTMSSRENVAEVLNQESPKLLDKDQSLLKSILDSFKGRLETNQALYFKNKE